MSTKLAEEIAGAPAEVLEKTIKESKHLAKDVSKQSTFKSLRNYWKTLGPGLTTGAADDDPSGIATYSQTGAGYGFQLLWLAAFSFPLMAVVQEMCARIGLVTGRGLAANVRHHFPRWVLYLTTSLLVVANTFNIGADIGAMAEATQLLVKNLDFTALILGYAFICLALQIFTSYESYARYLKWLAFILVAYILSAISIKLNAGELLLHGFVPSLTFSKDQILLITAILGTTISPYLFFWQTSQEVEEEILEGKTSIKLRQSEVSSKMIHLMRIDVWSGMFFSNLVMFFIIAACAATLFAHGITNIESAADAAEALRPFAGDSAYLLFALGIIGTGLLAVPVLAGGVSYAISESLGWKYGLYRKLKEARAFYGVIIFSTLIGVSLNFLGLNPMKVLIYSAVANGLVSPVILALIVLLSSNEKVMGKRKNGKVIKIVGWTITFIMTLAGIATIASFVLK